MRKNMYSLMLSEDVVAAVDRLAAQSGTNRSSLINTILAEYVSYRTPEMRMRDMFDAMERQLKQAGDLQVMLRSSDSLFQLRSMLSYKYNPVLNYSIELYRAPKQRVIGEIRIGLRTQNNNLKLCLLQFYKLWAKIEAAYHPEGLCRISGERFTKYLLLPEQNITEDDLSRSIAGYITAFDKGLKIFFHYLNNSSAAAYAVESCYREYLQTYRTLL